jgi:hypothetical protein
VATNNQVYASAPTIPMEEERYENCFLVALATSYYMIFENPIGHFNHIWMWQSGTTNLSKPPSGFGQSGVPLARYGPFFCEGSGPKGPVKRGPNMYIDFYNQ